MRQQEFFNYLKSSKSFGGDLLKGANARQPRPLSTKNAVHVVMRSQLAKGPMSLRHHRHKKNVESIIRRQAEFWGMRLYKYANVGNHLHLLLRPSSRRRFFGFLRSIAGLIARAVLKAERGHAKGMRFWQARPFTRIVRWGGDFVRAKEYVELNAKEALGFLSPRRMKKLGLYNAELPDTA